MAAAAPRAELEQAVLRVAVPFIAMVAILVDWAWDGSITQAESIGLLIAAVFLLCAVALALHILAVGENTNVSLRRIVGIFADNAVNTSFMLVMGEGGAIVFGVYLFVAFGNGFRYGRFYLHLSQVLGVLGFAVVLTLSDFWSKHVAVGMGVLAAMIVLPFYVGVLAERIKEAQRKADEANRAKGRFLANVSHEMRTPLNGVIAMADLLRETRLQEAQAEIVETLGTSAQLALAQVEQVLDAAKLDSGRIQIQSQPFDLGKLLTESIKVVLPQARYKGLTVLTNLSEESQGWFAGDPYHLRQVLLNLLSNAIKFTEKGTVTLRAMLIRRADDASLIRIEVEDTGIGIPASKLEGIFEAFVQADDSITRVYGGTGLGTTIAKQLVELMGGKIGVVSKEGSGSNFWIELPLGRANVAQPDLEAQTSGDVARSKTSAPIATVHKIRGAKVLVAEDNPTNQKVSQLILESRGHIVTIVNNGEEALDALERGPFDIAIFDLSMPVVSGLEALKMYRFAELHPIPVLILSANVTTELVTQCESAGAAEFLTKPIRASVLLDAIERHLSGQADRIVARQPRTDERPALSVVGTSPFDSTVLQELSQLSNDPTFIERLLAGFGKDCERLVSEILDCLAHRRYEAIRDAAHALKGGASSVGATLLFQFAIRLEKMNSETMRLKAAQLSEELSKLANQTTSAMATLVEEGRTQRQQPTGA